MHSRLEHAVALLARHLAMTRSLRKYRAVTGARLLGTVASRSLQLGRPGLVEPGALTGMSP